jgi:hypothetical protein
MLKKQCLRVQSGVKWLIGPVAFSCEHGNELPVSKKKKDGEYFV